MSVTDGIVTIIPAPAGYVVNFEHPQRNSELATYIVTGVGLFLSLLFILQRFYVNAVIGRRIGIDDGMYLLFDRCELDLC